MAGGETAGWSLPRTQKQQIGLAPFDLHTTHFRYKRKSLLRFAAPRLAVPALLAASCIFQAEMDFPWMLVSQFQITSAGGR
jgi:hypothetical protein